MATETLTKDELLRLLKDEDVRATIRGITSGADVANAAGAVVTETIRRTRQALVSPR